MMLVFTLVYEMPLICYYVYLVIKRDDNLECIDADQVRELLAIRTRFYVTHSLSDELLVGMKGADSDNFCKY